MQSLYDRMLLTEFTLTSLLFISERLRMYAEKQRYDGWYNNLAHPTWGSIGK